jgi:hypothetical protein
MGMLSQNAQHTPLLVRQAMLAQARSRVGHDGLACFEQQAGQVSMDKSGGCGHLFNMLNE